MEAEAWVQLALITLSCQQKDLATRLGVSPTQISKWKKGEHMSQEMQDKFRALLQIGDRNPSFVLWAGSLEAAIQWEQLFHYLAELALNFAETGYDTPPLHEDMELLCWHTFHTLKEMGVEIPQKFPQELLISDSNDSDEDWELDIEGSPYASLIYAIYQSLTDVYGFYAAYLSDWIFDDELVQMIDIASDINACLMELAASKVDADTRVAKNFQQFKRRVIKDYEEWLTTAKNSALRAGIPLRAELLDLVYGSHDAIGHEAEAESLGVHDSRLHPDIYMNELLVGMRAIHQVLPAILKKLGIEDEFQLDTSALRLGEQRNS